MRKIVEMHFSLGINATVTSPLLKVTAQVRSTAQSFVSSVSAS